MGVKTMISLGRTTSRPRKASGNLSEFAVCLLVFFLFALFPLINLVMFAASSGSAALITRNAAAAAANSATYGAALKACQASALNDLSGGFAKFAKLTANGGGASSGVDLYVIATPLAGGTAQTYGPNVGPTVGADTTNYIYEYQARGTFTLQPFVNMSSVPLINTVPVIGASTPFNYNAERAVENPTGLTSP
ncbi:MAG: hypothetical protein KGS72_05645 [Cyanobacteria bacterium REEB67]|nr:hypothetical protein [Cyanobacteria bacterium REEB67]